MITVKFNKLYTNLNKPIGYSTPCGDIFLELQRQTKMYHNYTVNNTNYKEGYINSITSWKNRVKNHVSGPHKNYLVCEWFLNYRDPFTNNNFISLRDDSASRIYNSNLSLDSNTEAKSWVDVTKFWQSNIVADPHNKIYDKYLNTISPQNRTQTDISNIFRNNLSIPELTPMTSNTSNTKNPFFGDLSIPIEKTLQRLDCSFMKGFDINLQYAVTINNQNITTPSQSRNISTLGLLDYYNAKYLNEQQESEFISQYQNSNWSRYGIIPFGVNNNITNWNTPLEYSSYTSVRTCRTYGHFLLPEELWYTKMTKMNLLLLLNKIKLSGVKAMSYMNFIMPNTPKLTCDKIIPNMINLTDRWRPGNIKEISGKIKTNRLDR